MNVSFTVKTVKTLTITAVETVKTLTFTAVKIVTVLFVLFQRWQDYYIFQSTVLYYIIY